LAADEADLLKAIAAYERVLDDSATEVRALAALRDLYSRTARHDDLLRVLDSLVSLVVEVVDQVDLQLEAARVFENSMDDVPSAIARYIAVLEIEPKHVSAVGELLRIARDAKHRTNVLDSLLPLLEREGRWDEHVELPSLEL